MHFFRKPALLAHIAPLLALFALQPSPLSIAQSARPPAHAVAAALTQTERQQLQNAMAADDAGHLQDALAILTPLAASHPDNFEVVEEAGLVLAESGDFEKALPLLRKAVRLKPSSAPAHANLAGVELKLQRTADAVASYRKAGELDPHNAQDQVSLGAALMQANQPAEAAAAFSKAAMSAPNDPDLLYNWSVALLAAGDTAKSAEVAARIPNPESSAQVQSLLGDLAERQNQFKEAVAHYQAAANLDPSEANIYALGMEFVRHWTFDPAMKIFDYGLQRYPSSDRLRTGQGIAKYANNNYAESALIFSSLLAVHPDNALYAQILGRSCALMPDSIAACDTLVDFARKHPGNAEADTYAAATILHRPSGPDSLAVAETLLNHALTAEPKLADAWFQMGMLRQQQDRWEDSKKPLETCIALNPRLAKAHYRLALAHSHTGEKDTSRAELALYQKYSEQEKSEMNARLDEVTTFLVSNK